MKAFKGRAKRYATGIEKALRRAAQQAELTAAITGTRLIIYEKGRIRRLSPVLKLKTKRAKLMVSTRTEAARPFQEYKNLNSEESQTRRKYTAIAEKDTKYGAK
jgi:tRNA isopentenyl-2-thiomethyl-A-37 hydroxylase MiaE